MLFCTYYYIVFFAAALLSMRVTESWPMLQRALLLTFSTVFYGYWDWRFLGLMWLTILITYLAALSADRHRGQPRARTAMLVGCGSALAILLAFKYFNFFQASLEQALSALGIHYAPAFLSIALPVGISFYTFQCLSYVLDVYRGDLPACRGLLLYSQYICFFPQLVAGPIERAGHLLPQLARPIRVRAACVMSGGLLILLGCLKKALLADTLGLYITDPVFADPHGPAHLWAGLCAFSLQIYFDFAGYSDVARGSARCLGIELVQNFNAPYFARNIAEFWRRWHISLSGWFRDYVYIPMGGNRRGYLVTLRNAMVTMLLCGLWHGANTTFILWGAYHGLLLIAHRLLSDRPRRAVAAWGAWAEMLWTSVGRLVTLLAVLYGWLIFRVNSLDSLVVNTRLLLGQYGRANVSGLDYAASFHAMVATLAVGALCLLVCHYVDDRFLARQRQVEDVAPPVVVGVLAGLGLIALFALGTMAERMPFLYFQF